MASGAGSIATGRGWQVLQGAGVLTTLFLLVALISRPELSLRLLWNVVIPLVPASLLLSPLVWRNVCPLATLNMAGNRWSSRRRASPKWTTRTNLIGIGLFALLVPARRFLFNEDGTALAIVIVAVILGALVLGILYDGRAGFCNAMCPILPIERIYGQRPLLRVGRARCASCSACGRACIDLSPERAVDLVAKTDASTTGWLRSPLGAFAAALPGFIVGYFTLADGPLSIAISVYIWIGMFAAVSYVVIRLAFQALSVPIGRGLPILAALAAALYYWFAAPGMAEALRAPVGVGYALRIATLGLVIIWVGATLSRERQSRVS